MERDGKLKAQHRQCSHSDVVPVPDNHLTCCLGVACRDCEFLKALDLGHEMTLEQRDEAKAFTCATHIISKGGDLAGEGFILTTDDRMYWDNVYTSLASAEPQELNP
jgi:hypothetical protein